MVVLHVLPLGAAVAVLAAVGLRAPALALVTVEAVVLTLVLRAERTPAG